MIYIIFIHLSTNAIIIIILLHFFDDNILSDLFKRFKCLKNKKVSFPSVHWPSRLSTSYQRNLNI